MLRTKTSSLSVSALIFKIIKLFFHGPLDKRGTLAGRAISRLFRVFCVASRSFHSQQEVLTVGRKTETLADDFSRLSTFRNKCVGETCTCELWAAACGPSAQKNAKKSGRGKSLRMVKADRERRGKKKIRLEKPCSVKGRLKKAYRVQAPVRLCGVRPKTIEAQEQPFGKLSSQLDVTRVRDATMSGWGCCFGRFRNQLIVARSPG